MNTAILVTSVEKIDFEKPWKQFLNAVTGPAGPLLTFLAIAGVLIIVGAVISWMFNKKRSGQLGGDSSGNNKVVFAILIGAVFAAPSIIGLILRILSAAANLFVSVLNIK